jgi:hypothetical protein
MIHFSYNPRHDAGKYFQLELQCLRKVFKKVFLQRTFPDGEKTTSPPLLSRSHRLYRAEEGVFGAWGRRNLQDELDITILKKQRKPDNKDVPGLVSPFITNGDYFPATVLPRSRISMGRVI